MRAGPVAASIVVALSLAGCGQAAARISGSAADDIARAAGRSVSSRTIPAQQVEAIAARVGTSGDEVVAVAPRCSRRAPGPGSGDTYSAWTTATLELLEDLYAAAVGGSKEELAAQIWCYVAADVPQP